MREKTLVLSFILLPTFAFDKSQEEDAGFVFVSFSVEIGQSEPSHDHVTLQERFDWFFVFELFFGPILGTLAQAL